MRRMLFLFVLLINNSVLAEITSDSCDCPEVKCTNPCEEQAGITFYTEKCQEGKKVKSCAKPTCISQETPNEVCLAFKKDQLKNRAIASEKTEPVQNLNSNFENSPTIGMVSVFSGQAWLKNEMGVQRDVVLGIKVRENDTVITSSIGRLKIKINNGNIINVLPNSMMKMTEINIEAKKTIIDLYKGKIRSQVNEKLQGAKHYFKVRTRSAVAGVRGTDFVVSYDVTQKAVTKIQTIEGNVELSSGDSTKKQTILGGQEGSFIVASNSSDVFSEEEINDFISRGYMTPVYKMTGTELKDLNWETDASNKIVGGRALAAKKGKAKEICSEPKAQLNQCYWKCENNPKGEKRCRTDLPYVNCVRKLCNANGKWSDETRLPATFFDKCEPQKTKVGACDY